MARTSFHNIIINVVVFAILLIFALFPLVFMLLMSMKPPELALQPIFIFTPTLENYVTVLFEKNFIRPISNSITVAFSSALLALAVSVPSAYALSRRPSKYMIIALFSILFIPILPVSISAHFFSRSIGIHGTLQFMTLILTAARAPFITLLLKPLFDAVPLQVEEAAMIDGAGLFRLLRSIILPISRPALICSFLYGFFLSWNDYSLTYLLSNPETQLATSFLMTQRGIFETSWSELASSTILIAMPGIILAFILQHYLKKSFIGIGLR
ncbi:MAG: carbohydrate ABC transporter permease [Nitrososphaerota archaeon]